MSVEWKPNKHNKILLLLLERNVGKAMRFAEGECKKLISRGNVTGMNPSSDGDPPKVVTGVLRSSIDTEVSRDSLGVSGYLGVRKGVAENYGFWLEFGTSKMAARPFLRPTLANNKRKILDMIGKGKR